MEPKAMRATNEQGVKAETEGGPAEGTAPTQGREGGPSPGNEGAGPHQKGRGPKGRPQLPPKYPEINPIQMHRCSALEVSID